MNFFKKIGAKFKIAFIFIAGIVSLILFFYAKGNSKIKKQMEYELSRVKKETELVHLSEDTKEKEEQLKDLKQQEAVLLDKIKYIEEKDTKGEEVSVDELEDFFAKRGF